MKFLLIAIALMLAGCESVTVNVALYKSVAGPEGDALIDTTTDAKATLPLIGSENER